MRPLKIPLVLVSFVALSCSSPALAHTPDDHGSASLAHARVVNLTLVKGTVIARKPGASKWVRAGLEMSLEEGMSIATARDSIAEVQFENGSSLRMSELSRVDFTQLALAPHGGRVTQLAMAFGVATMNVTPARRDEYFLNASNASLTPRGKAEFRIDLRHKNVRVEVFRGLVEMTDSSQSVRLSKNQVVAYDDGAGVSFQVTQPIQTDQWDHWVLQRDRQAVLASYRDTEALADRFNDWSHVVPPPGLFGGGADDGF